jgi:hypothetical protein
MRLFVLRLRELRELREQAVCPNNAQVNSMKFLKKKRVALIPLSYTQCDRKRLHPE